MGSRQPVVPLELGGLSGSQGGSSFAERVGVAPEVSRGCRRKAVEGGRKMGGRRERQKIIIIKHHYYHRNNS